MLAIADCWKALVEELQKLGHYQEVQPLSLEKVTDASFFQSLPSLKVPAAVVTLRGLDQSIEGSGRYRDAHWSLISVVKDVRGDGYLTNLGIYDSLVDGTDPDDEATRFFDKQILDDELTILGSHALGIVAAHESLSVLELTFDTREAGER
jgi:hypothetical protein